MLLIFTDFETYWDDDYTLKSMSTHEYVHDDRFEVMSVAVALGDSDKTYVVGQDKVEKLLHTLPWNEAALVAHNIAFDGYILSQRFGIVPRVYLDTVGMANAMLGARIKRASLYEVTRYFGIEGKSKAKALTDTKGKRWAELDPDERIALMEYNRDDVIELREVFRRLFANFPSDEVPSLDWVGRAACNPKFLLDVPLLEEELKQEKAMRRYLLQQAGVERSVIMSNRRFAEALEQLGVEPPMKVSPTTGRETYAFAKNDREFQALRSHPDPKVRALVEARLALKSTIKESRAARFLNMAKIGKPVPLPLVFSGAVNTHRFSGGGGINPQNLPKKSIELVNGEVKKVPGRIRRAMKAPPGYKVVVVDSSNIELRVNNWLANNTSVLDAVRAGRDPYCEFASVVFGTEVNPKAYPEGSPEHEEHKKMRTLGKIGMLALQYGMGVDKYIHTVWSFTGDVVPRSDAEKIVQTYRTMNGQVKALWYALDGVLKAVAQGQTPTIPTHQFPNLGVFQWHMPEPNSLHVVMPHGLAFKYEKLELTEMGEIRMHHARKGSVQDPTTSIWGGVMTENCTQGLASNIIRQQMRRIGKEYRERYGLDSSHIALQVHDELVSVVPEEIAEEVLELKLRIMSEAPEWAPGLPLAAEGSIADSYGEAK